MRSRSAWKLPFINPLVYKNNFKKREYIYLRSRNILISKALLTKKFEIYNGKVYKSKTLINVNLGHKLGEFSFTRRCDINIHRVKKAKKIKKKSK